MSPMRLRHRRCGLAGAMLVCGLLSGGCGGALMDAAAAGALDLVQGSVTGVVGTAIFGETPSPLIFNSILNAIGGSGGGGGGHH